MLDISNVAGNTFIKSSALSVVLIPACSSDLRSVERMHINDALAMMDKCHYPTDQEVFSILYLKLDRKRQTGGQWVRVEKAQKCGLPYAVKDKRMRGLVDLSSGKKTAIHIDLVFEINGMKIYK